MPPAIPNFRLTTPIGEGGFGEVWLAETVTGKRRAVKIVKRERFEAEGRSEQEVDALFRMEFEGVQRFEDLAAQARGLISIQHVGQNEAAGFYYYVMPLADDRGSEKGDYQALNLERRIERDGAMDWEDAIDTLRQLAQGLRVLHREGLCHGDVTSANVLFLEGQPVLADPGLTRLDGRASVTTSPGFSDPHAGPNTERCGDVFALGRVLYHGVTGLHPAEHFPLVPPDRMRDLPVERLAALLDRCCDPDPAERFPDADALLEALEREAPSRDSTAPPSRGWRSRGLLAASAIGIALLAMMGLSARAGDRSPAYAEVGDGMLSVFAEQGGQLLWRKNLGMNLFQAEVVDLDEDGTPEVLCAVRHVSHRDGGCLLVYEANGDLRWRFETTLDFNNYTGLGSDEMACFGFLAENWDGSPGKELVVVSHHAMDWYPTALIFLSSGGELTGAYWHPGHIHTEDLRFVRETDNSLPMLAFKGLNNGLGRPLKELEPGKQKHRTVVGLLDPRVTGHHEAPPGHGELKGADKMSQWYRMLDPQWVDSRPVEVEDRDGDGVNELAVWCGFGGLKEFAAERVHFGWILDFQGEALARVEGDGHVGEAALVQAGQIGLIR